MRSVKLRKERKARFQKPSSSVVLRMIYNDIIQIRERMLDQVPGHFSQRDIANALLGSLFIGLTFIMRLDLIDIARNLGSGRAILVVLSTFLIITAEIYFLSYSRVPNKKDRPFGQFWAKRFTTLSVVTFFVSLFLVYIFGINHFAATGEETFKIIILVSIPCAVGAAAPSIFSR